MGGILEGIDRIIIETDEENPVAIAEITENEIVLADGYRARLRPDYPPIKGVEGTNVGEDWEISDKQEG